MNNSPTNRDPKQGTQLFREDLPDDEYLRSLREPESRVSVNNEDDNFQNDMNREISEEPHEEYVPRNKMERVNKIITMVVQWCLAILLLLFIAFVVFGILYSGIHYHGSKWHEGEDDQCSTPFGSILGEHNGVFAYSNCNDTYTHDETHKVSGAFNESGIKWQCVEYARRYWMLHGIAKPASFDSVEGAADIWSLSKVQLQDGSTAPLQKFPNGLGQQKGGSAPREGDLLIYPRQKDDLPYGHVAVIVGVREKSVLVAEQNWDNTVWPKPYHNFSRELSLAYTPSTKAYTISEKDKTSVQGWIRY